MQNNLFKKSSVERFSSPEKLNDYIQVSNPSSWMVLGAALVLLLGVLVWGFFGELTQSERFTGVVRDGSVFSYVNNGVAAVLEEGMEVSIVPMSTDEHAQAVKGRVTYVADRPLSYKEASEGIEGEYLLATLGISTWNIPVTVVPDEPLYEGLVYYISAVTETQRPIDLVFQ